MIEIVIVSFLYLISGVSGSGAWSSDASSSRASSPRDWESLKFVLPSDHSPYSKSCKALGKNYCLLGMEFSDTQTNRLPQETDIDVFKALLRLEFDTLSWYSLNPITKGGCCDVQANVYLFQGQHKGLSPREYLDRIKDYSLEHKHVNWIKAVFIPELCANMITEVGFGIGDLKIVGRTVGDNFIFPRIFWGEYTVIQRAEIPTHPITQFQWFKQMIMCYDHPWICGNREANRRHSIAGYSGIGGLSTGL
ncbi:uncharacterized protein LOC142354251 [Convolutriloba macropyga]|uniref:uncharacterized protein LOC142354251 n=1 Tax=Convolutriloba macropyga TaxID=536237 RepID=UPI003F528522